MPVLRADADGVKVGFLDALKRAGTHLPSDETAAKIIIKAAVLTLARSLGTSEQRQGLQLTYQRLGVSAVLGVLAGMRRHRKVIGVEIRTLLRDGPEKYIARTLSDLVNLSQTKLGDT